MKLKYIGLNRHVCVKIVIKVILKSDYDNDKLSMFQVPVDTTDVDHWIMQWISAIPTDHFFKFSFHEERRRCVMNYIS